MVVGSGDRGLKQIAARRATAAFGVVILVISLAGCGWRPPEAPAGPPFEPFALRAGYAYVAVLATEHPLYGELRKLDDAITAMRKASQPAAAPAPQPLMSEFFLTAPAAPAFPSGAWQLDYTAWRSSLQPLQPPDVHSLSQDLQVILNWQARELEQQFETQMRAVESKEERDLAELRAKLVKRRQEELANLGLRNLDMDDARALAQADEAAKRIWGEIDVESATATAASDQRVAAEREKRRAAAVAKLQAVEDGLRKKMADRAHTAVSAGEKERGELETMLSSIKPEVARPSPAEFSAPVASAAVQRALLTTRLVWDAYGKTRDKQINDLALRKAELTKQILDATDAAARAAAFEQGVELRVVPGEDAAGSDVTESIRKALRQRWAQSPSY